MFFIMKVEEMVKEGLIYCASITRNTFISAKSSGCCLTLRLSGYSRTTSFLHAEYSSKNPGSKHQD